MERDDLYRKLNYILNTLDIPKDQKNEFINLFEEINNAANKEIDAATKDSYGVVKQCNAIALLDSSDEITTVIDTVNELITNLKTATIMAK